MDPEDIAKLRALTGFPALVAYLRDELDWPIEVEDADEVAFDYDAAELGINPKHTVKIESIKQVRPLVDNQPWGIFYIEFESKRLPVVVLRRILRALRPTRRKRSAEQPVWRMRDLLFISAQGETGYRSISFAHFRAREGRVAELRTFSWDTREAHFYYIKNLNLEALRWPEDEIDIDAWRTQWRQAFTVEHRYTIRTSQKLAREMAHHAATVRELVNEVYALETDEGPLHQLYGSFKEVLLHGLIPDAFADMVAQTVAYGLFSAAAQSGELTYDRMVELIPSTNPFLRDLLAELTTEGAVDLEELGVGQLVEMLRQTDVEAILHDFGRQTGGGREDPVVHFYELFLSEYDKEKKVKRGVFYTPDPVVSYIVRSVDYLLKTEFGLADGLADTSVDPETGEALVQILDPATGTGTFLTHVIDQIERTVKARPGADWNAYVAEHLLPRLNGFELMMAPYAVAHMKLGLRLRQTGYDFASGERLRVYLTNTLEEPVEAHEVLAFAGFLSKEANQAARVKRQVPVTVVIGNPPYSVSSANKGEYIEGLMERYKAAVRDEINIQPLSNDYIKFIRFAHDLIERTGHGVIGMITSNSYLSGLIHRGVREELMKTFDEVFALNLHGAQIEDVVPNGNLDENVFEIQEGVAIALFVGKRGNKDLPNVLYEDLWGLREAKYAYLLENDVSTTDWRELKPGASVDFFFVPKEFGLQGEFSKGWSIVDVFGTHDLKNDRGRCWGSGVKTNRDHLLVDFDRQTLEDRVGLLADTTASDQEVKSRFGLQDSKYWNTNRERQKIREADWRQNIVPYLYRPFDRRWLLYQPNLIEIGRGGASKFVMRHLLRKNIALIAVRQVLGAVYSHFGVSRWIADNRAFFSNRGVVQVFPLYLYTTPEETAGTLFANQELTREPNLSQPFIASVKEALELSFVPDGTGNTKTTFGPEDVFHYTYAVFHSPTYRTRYADFLKIDFPRLPLTSDRGLFRALCALGADLVALHLLEDDYPAASWNVGRFAKSPLQEPITTFVKRATGTTMGAFSKSKCYEDAKVYLDTSQRSRSSYFDGVPEDVWNFYVGGYQVCRKWLYDRRGKRGQPGRTLTADDIAHYQCIVVALKATIRLMEEIDEVIEAHGGWPIE